MLFENFLEVLEEESQANLWKCHDMVWSCDSIMLCLKLLAEVLTGMFKEVVYQENSDTSYCAAMVVGIGLLEFAYNHLQSQYIVKPADKQAERPMPCRGEQSSQAMDGRNIAPSADAAQFDEMKHER